MKKLSFIILIIVVFVQLAVPFSMIHSQENILRNGELFRFKTRPIDPADPFQGRYVWLNIEQDYIITPKESVDLHYKEFIFAIVEADEKGFAHFTSWSREKQKQKNFLKTRYLGSHSEWDPETKKYTHKGLRLEIPFDRYYMEETKAPRAETLARDATRTTNCWVEVRILNGKAVIEDVFAEGQSLRELAATDKNQLPAQSVP